MHQEISKWVKFFQGLIYTKFRQQKSEAIEVLTSLIVGHLFGLYNLNQLSDALLIPKSSLYQHLSCWSLSQWKRLLLEIACQQAYEHIVQTESMSEATQSRRRITLSVDDTVQQRDGKVLAYCYHWYSGRFHKTLAGQNILAVTIKIGHVVIPLVVRLVPKQGRANTQKPQLLVQMLSEVIDFFSNRRIEITDYPITFDSWYGSQPLREELETFGFSQILVHAKSSYVFTIKKENAKLSTHKATVVLDENAWGCSCPVCRVKAESPTFGKLVLLFFKDGGKVRCMMAFGRPLRGVEILSVWHQHHGIEQFWRNLKSHVQLHQMRMRGRDGAYASLAVKVLSYLLLTHLTLATGLTFHQIALLLSGQRASFWETIEHFHQDITTER
jgi:hypothetical protein